MTVKLDHRVMDRSAAPRTLCHLPPARDPAVTSGQGLPLDLCRDVGQRAPGPGRRAQQPGGL